MQMGAILTGGKDNRKRAGANKRKEKKAEMPWEVVAVRGMAGVMITIILNSKVLAGLLMFVYVGLRWVMFRHGTKTTQLFKICEVGDYGVYIRKLGTQSGHKRKNEKKGRTVGIHG